MGTGQSAERARTQTALGNPAPVPGAAPIKPPTKDTSQNVSGHVPVEQAAALDTVGDQVQPARPPNVRFPGQSQSKPSVFWTVERAWPNALIVRRCAH